MTNMMMIATLALSASFATGFQQQQLNPRSNGVPLLVSVRTHWTTTTSSSSSSSITRLFSTTKLGEKTVPVSQQQEQGEQKAASVLSSSRNFDYSQGDIASNAVQEKQDQEVNDNNDMLGGLFWRGCVVILCALWASNFPAAKLVMAEPGVDSSLYAVARFGVAALALVPGAIATTRKTGMDMETLRGSLICGSWVAFGYLGQTLGLLTTTASRSCVICSLHCVFVAMVAELWRVSRETANGVSTNFDFMRLVPAAIAVAGVAVIELKGAAGGPNIGDLLSFAQPIGFGLGYLQLENLMAKRPDTALAVSAIKLSVVAMASLAMFEITPLVQSGFDLSSFSLEIPNLTAIFSSTTALSGIVWTGLVTTALALWVESKAFAQVPATDASIILTTEPLMAAGLGALALGETFGLSDYAGASLIVGACVMATLMSQEGAEEEEEEEMEA